MDSRTAEGVNAKTGIQKANFACASARPVRKRKGKMRREFIKDLVSQAAGTITFVLPPSKHGWRTNYVSFQVTTDANAGTRAFVVSFTKRVAGFEQPFGMSQTFQNNATVIGSLISGIGDETTATEGTTTRAVSDLGNIVIPEGATITVRVPNAQAGDVLNFFQASFIEESGE